MIAFGTDGVRGRANTELTPQFVLRLGRAAARVLGPGPYVIGRDTRVSGPSLQAALSAGLTSEGASVIDLGVVPTPAVASAAARRGIAGAVVSASHNPYADNGIKLFAPGGSKLSDEIEQLISAELAQIADSQHSVEGADVGSIEVDSSGATEYVEAVVEAVGDGALAGMRLVLDCANGAASSVAPDIFRRLGAEVDVLHATPNGVNINEKCGSTYPESLAERVVATGASAGLALDGDADRVVAVDEAGRIVDGDHLIALLALDMRAKGQLVDDTVVVTVMTNLGFRHAMDAAGVHVHETAVGDRYLLEALAEHGWSLGGEQSGHVIFSDIASTGDGALTGAKVMDLVGRSGRSFGDLASAAMTQLPQVLLNTQVTGNAAAVAAQCAPQIEAAAASLGDRGRVLVRPSGTEPVIRVMVEAPTDAEALSVAEALSASIEAAAAK